LSNDGLGIRKKMSLLNQLKVSDWGQEAAKHTKGIVLALSLVAIGLIGFIASMIALAVGDVSSTTGAMIGMFVSAIVGLGAAIYLNVIRIRVSLAVIRGKLPRKSDT
jgi:hypothetical protein